MAFRIPDVSVRAVEFLNLRGYESAALNLNRNFTAVVGDNNQGKSSALLLLDFLLNQADNALLASSRQLSAAESEILLPANSARHRARRLTLRIQCRDLRTARRFGSLAGNEALLRMSIHRADRKIQLNVGQPTRSEPPDPLGLELVQRLRQSVSFQLIPAARDVSSAWFGELMKKQLSLILRTHIPQLAGRLLPNYRISSSANDVDLISYS